jgi:hypothetical protein
MGFDPKPERVRCRRAVLAAFYLNDAHGVKSVEPKMKSPQYRKRQYSDLILV